MAHPLTLPFPSAPRPSPLAFGFGLPATASPSACGTPPRSPALGPSFGAFGLGFGSTPSGSPKKPPVRPGFSPSPSAFRTTTTSSLKRARRSPSPARSSSPTPSNSSQLATSPLPASSELPRKERDELSVGGLLLKDDDRRPRKEVKRLRKDVSASSSSSSANQTAPPDVDVGVLLATLPASSHLSILMNVLSAHPTLQSEVLNQLPQPELSECLAQLDRRVEKVRRAVGSTAVQLNPDRVWTRAQGEIEEYCRMGIADDRASTYLNYFTSPSSSRLAEDPHTIQNLLRTLSTQLYYLVRLIPPNGHVEAGTTRRLLDLGKTVISSWTSWVSALSAEVNERSGMYPHSTVQTWATNLDTLAATPASSSSVGSPVTPSFAPWAYPQPQPAEETNSMVESFRSAMIPVRDRFVAELGWLIGRHAQTSFNQWSNANETPITTDDEEL